MIYNFIADVEREKWKSFLFHFRAEESKKRVNTDYLVFELLWSLMMRFFLRIGFLLGLVFTSVTLAATNPVSLEDFLGWSLKNHPFLDQQALRQKQVDQALRIEKAAQAWHLKNTASYLHSKPIQSTIFVANSQDVLDLGVSIERPLWDWGGHFKTSMSYNLLDQENSPDQASFGFPSRFHTNEIAVEYRQQLLQNKGGLNDKLAQDLQVLEQERSKIQIEENREEFVLQVARHFLEWVFLWERLEVAQDRYNLAQDAHRYSKRLFDARLTEKVDLMRADTAMADTHQNLLLAKADYESKTTELSVLYDFPSLLQSYPKGQIYKSGAVPIDAPDFRVLRITDLSIQQLEREQKTLKDKTKADLSLQLKQSVASGQPGFSDSFRFDRGETYVGLDYQLELGQQALLAKIDSATFQIEEANLGKEVEKRRLIAIASRALQQLTYWEKILDLNIRQVDLAKKTSEEEARLYQHGRSDLSNLIQAQDQVLHARLTYLNHARAYQEERYQYLAFSDQLTIDLGLDLEKVKQ